MTKLEAIKEFVAREMQHVPQEWVQIIAEKNGQYPRLGMWGTCFIVDNFLGELFLKHAVEMRNYDEDNPDEDNVDVRMAGEMRIGDTAAYLHEVADEWVISIDGAGFHFYDGVWDRLYDLLGLSDNNNEHELS